MADLWIDLETFSPVPIKHGISRYAEQAEVLLFGYALDDEDPHVWDVAAGEPCPPELEEAFFSPEFLVWAQNGTQFDWVVLRAVMRWVHDAVLPNRRRDTMVQAYSHSLPGNLAMMCAALGVKDEESKLDGKRFIRLFCMPPPKNVKDRTRATRLTHPVEWEEFKTKYAARDIIAMRAAHKKMPTWNYRGKQLELELEQLDAKVNARGVFMDVTLARAAVRASDIAKVGLAVRTRELTDDEVSSATKRDAMLAHILSLYGIDLPDMQKDTIERRASDESLPEELRELLRVRLMSTTTSVAKFTSLLNGVSSDGRLRGMMQFRGAARTGRRAHRLMQMGNMMRPDMKAHEIEFAIKLLKLDAAHLVYDNVMRVCANAIRGTIIASPGKKLVVADLANIEGRMAAWLAGEEWKLQAFRDYDTIIPDLFDAKGKPVRKGPDLYLVAYASSFNVPVESIDTGTIEGFNQRQIGKVEELMFQYGGGVGAWITGAATYGIDLDQMTEQVFDVLPDWAKKEAEDFMHWLYEGPEETHRKAIAKLEAARLAGDSGIDDLIAEADAKLEARKLKARHMLSEKTFITCDAIKRLWRKAHPEISSIWKELENAIRACIETPGIQLSVRRLKVRRDASWLRVGLPSGRVLCYPLPAWDLTVPAADGKPARHYAGFSYMGISQYTKRWERINSYGGKVFENATQAAACDQLLECQPAIEEAGFEIVLDVHDEDVTEAPIDRDDLNPELLGAMMCADLGWNAGLPLAAAGWQGQRYRKE